MKTIIISIPIIIVMIFISSNAFTLEDYTKPIELQGTLSNQQIEASKPLASGTTFDLSSTLTEDDRMVLQVSDKIYQILNNFENGQKISNPEVDLLVRGTYLQDQILVNRIKDALAILFFDQSVENTKAKIINVVSKSAKFKALSKIVEDVRKGDKNVLKSIKYSNVEALSFVVSRASQAKNMSPIAWLINNEKDGNLNVSRAFYYGLFNVDPKVRLFSISALLEIKNLSEMLHNGEEGILLSTLKSFEETVDDYYTFRNINGNLLTQNPKNELSLLIKTCVRSYLVEQLNAGIKLFKDNKWISGINVIPSKEAAAANMFSNIKEEDFLLLSDQLENESIRDVPLNKITAEYIPFIYGGLSNKSSVVKEKCSYLIVRETYNPNNEKYKDMFTSLRKKSRLLDAKYLIFDRFKDGDKNTIDNLKVADLTGIMLIINLDINNINGGAIFKTYLDGNFNTSLTYFAKILRTSKSAIKTETLAKLMRLQLLIPFQFKHLTEIEFAKLVTYTKTSNDRLALLKLAGQGSVEYFISGLANKNAFIKNTSADFIADMYPKLNNEYKNKVDQAMEVYPELKQSIQKVVTASIPPTPPAQNISTTSSVDNKIDENGENLDVSESNPDEETIPEETSEKTEDTTNADSEAKASEDNTGNEASEENKSDSSEKPSGDTSESQPSESEENKTEDTPASE